MPVATLANGKRGHVHRSSSGNLLNTSEVGMTLVDTEIPLAYNIKARVPIKSGYRKDIVLKSPITILTFVTAVVSYKQTNGHEKKVHFR